MMVGEGADRGGEGGRGGGVAPTNDLLCERLGRAGLVVLGRVGEEAARTLSMLLESKRHIMLEGPELRDALGV